ncbi:TRF2-interacting telomeric protein/Rap1 C terminal domain-containing protein [Chaetomium sp. MPI-CAGE-AT-0009]|nr:TRF2-interacting telomeric protein/Rap1 C terminal domain-containing protein [Chaetomium sp. MPI-CAGE-AT-0009]
MAAPIVYDGVKGKYEGTLFNGLKFWVSQRVPTRSSILGRIRDNGGKLVELEKFADVLIADHARKDCPPKSVSWKYIEECVTKGELVNIEDYRIHETTPPKTTAPIKGTKYPHHSWHSWRDKWVNKMSLLGEDQLPPVLQELPPPRTQPANDPQTAPDTSAPPARPTPARRDVKTSSGRDHKPEVRSKNFFTDEDDKILAKYVAERIQAGNKPNGNKIYQELEEKVSLTGIEIEPGEEGWFPATKQGPAVPQDDGESTTPEEAEDEPGQTNHHAAPTPNKTTPVLSREEFWRTFNEYNQLNDTLPGPWVQIDRQAVDFWDLWRCATGQEPNHSSRDWEIIAENLGFDWIEKPHVPVHLKIAFEKHLLEFEGALREFDQWDEEEEEDDEEEEEGGHGGEEGGEGEMGAEEENDEEVQAVDEEGGTVEEADDDETASQESDANFASSPPINLKRARVLSHTPFSSSVRKRPRYDPDIEVPETPETRTERAGQGVAGARAVAANQRTPTRRPRHAQPARPREMEDQYSRPIPQYDGAEDDALLSPSQQLRSEIEAAAIQEEPSRSAPGATSPANPPLPSDGDEASESSDAFEAIDNLPVRPPPPRHHENPHRRTLPWSKDKGKQPATALTPQPPPRAGTTPTTAATQPTPRNHPLSTPHPRTPTRTSTTTAPNPPPDPGPILKHFLGLNLYPPALIARAVRATTCHFGNTEIVLDNLVLGKGVPANMRGVWTEEDDRVLSAVGVGGKRDKDNERALQGLVKKHGREGVIMRRAFLRGLDGA